MALKVALVPWDERFEREAELLSRVRHPSIPRLWAQGQWHPQRGPPHPFLVMDWVEGEPLYEWAQEQGATSQQVLGALAQVAGALAAVHAQNGVHRDVKGGNVRVRRSDGRAMDEAGAWRLEGRRAGAVQALNPRVDSRLSQCIDGMLAVAPEQRGSAAHWAQELEQASHSAGVKSALPLVAKPAAHLKRRRGQPWWAVGTAAVVALAGWAVVRSDLQSPRAVRKHASHEADTAGLAEKVSAASMRQAPEAADPKGMADEPLPEPVPGQSQPNAKGQCPYLGQVVLNGACWEKFEADQAQCERMGDFFKKACYVPVTPRQRPPTSNPSHE